MPNMNPTVEACSAWTGCVPLLQCLAIWAGGGMMVHKSVSFLTRHITENPLKPWAQLRTSVYAIRGLEDVLHASVRPSSCLATSSAESQWETQNT